MKRFILEALAIVVAVCAVVGLMDLRRVFAQEENNNHTGKGWYYLYKYAKEKRKDIDVIVLGNSHAYAGVLPNDFEEATGHKCFVLASSGCFMTEAYYMAEEALKLVKPKVMVVETYLLRDYKQKGGLDADDMSNQFKSFENRRNVWLKLKSMPALFTVNDAPFAWSRTLRNHSYIFDNPKLVKYNLQHPKPPVYKDKEFMGEFVKFNSGLTEPTLERYRREGAPVNGKDIYPGEDACKYLAKLRALCKKNGVQLVFFTIPMYHEHVSSPDLLMHNLGKVIGDTPWMFLQSPSYNDYFTPDCFEDTYRANQHQTRLGAYRTTTCLAHFLRSLGLV